MRKQMKRRLIIIYELLWRITKYRKYYFHYFLFDKVKIYKELKSKGFFSIKKTAFSQWKLWYGTLYLKAKYKYSTDTIIRVFIKINGPKLQDCYENELIVNNYIKTKSRFISNHTCKMVYNNIIDKHYVTAFEYIPFSDVSLTHDFNNAFDGMIMEYTKVGIIHTDFQMNNMGYYNNQFYFYDYGTSICKLGKYIRLRNGASYNHIADITESASSVLRDADFYYDDVIHSQINSNINRNDINFIVGKGKDYYVRLSGIIYHFKEQNNRLIPYFSDENETTEE